MNTKSIFTLLSLVVGITSVNGDCFAELYGYPCCTSDESLLQPYFDPESNHYFAVENGKTCGVIKTEQQKICASGDTYNCCTTTCDVAFVDSELWGVENGDWCSLPFSCYPKQQTKTTLSLPAISVTPTPNIDTSVCSKLGEPCGGSLYGDIDFCCEEGTFCYERSTFYHYCVNEDYDKYIPFEPVEDGKTDNQGNNQQTSPIFVIFSAPPPPPMPRLANGCSYYYDLCGSENGYPDCCPQGFMCTEGQQVNDQGNPVRQCLEDPDQVQVNPFQFQPGYNQQGGGYYPPPPPGPPPQQQPQVLNITIPGIDYEATIILMPPPPPPPENPNYGPYMTPISDEGGNLNQTFPYDPNQPLMQFSPYGPPGYPYPYGSPYPTSTTTTKPKATTCAKAYYPCGGNDFPDAAGCCVEGYYCNTDNPDFHVCKEIESTATSATATATATATSTADSKCAPVMEMCGGSKFKNAPNCCQKGSTCVKVSADYFQCIPDEYKGKYVDYDKASTTKKATTTTKKTTTKSTTAKSTTTTKKATTTTTTTKKATTTTKKATTTSKTSSTECAKVYEVCGGINHNGPTCCEEGTECVVYNNYYHQCEPL